MPLQVGGVGGRPRGVLLLLLPLLVLLLWRQLLWLLPSPLLRLRLLPHLRALRLRGIGPQVQGRGGRAPGVQERLLLLGPLLLAEKGGD